MDQVNGVTLLRSFQEGGKRIIEKRSELNSINVFPVADADTGNNLASLMRSINEIEVTDKMLSFSQVLHIVADKSLESGKGNSGMIFAQYFNGISRFYSKTQDDVNHLVDSFVKAVTYAYDAVQKPEEGTMLTVINIWAHELRNAISTFSFAEALTKAKTSAYNAALKTKQQHRLMRKNNVVDAGAQGFYLFIEGLTDVFTHAHDQKSSWFASFDDEEEQKKNHEVNKPPKYHYCMEVILRSQSTELDITALLASYGDSMVVVKGSNHVKVHIHTDYPQKIVDVISKKAQISRIKIDDMKQQYYDQNLNKQSIALATDSIADLPKEIMDRYNVHILPLTILVDETEHLDKLTVTNTELLTWRHQKNHMLSTSLPSQASILRLIENLESSYDQLLFISVSSSLSGTYKAVQNAINAYKGKLHVRVIDSKLNSIAQGLLVKRAGMYIEQGYSFDSLVQQIEKDKKNIRIYVSVSDLEPMIQSGRIPQRLGKVLKKLGLMPVVTLNTAGEGKLTRIGFTVKQNQRTIKNLILQLKEKVNDLLIGYTSDQKDAYEWQDYLTAQNFMQPEVVATSSIIALSAGNKATAVAVMIQKGDS